MLCPLNPLSTPPPLPFAMFSKRTVLFCTFFAFFLFLFCACGQGQIRFCLFLVCPSFRSRSDTNRVSVVSFGQMAWVWMRSQHKQSTQMWWFIELLTYFFGGRFLPRFGLCVCVFLLWMRSQSSGGQPNRIAVAYFVMLNCAFRTNTNDKFAFLCYSFQLDFRHKRSRIESQQYYWHWW